MKKRFIGWLLVVCMVITMIPGTAFATTKEKQGLITVYQDNKLELSMCNKFFAEEVQMVEKEDNVVLKMYIAYLEKYDSEKTGETLKDFVVTFEGQEYKGKSDVTTKPLKAARETNEAFGLVKGKEVPTQVVTVELPKKAFLENHLDAKASVIAMGGTTAEFDMVVTDKESSDSNKNENKDEIEKIHEIRVNTGASGLNEFYVFNVKVYKYGNVITEILDKTGSLSGQYNLMLGQYIEAKGLSQYTLKTFNEVKEMKRPDPMKTMAGSYDEMPGNIHDELIRLINKLEGEEDSSLNSKKTDLAKAFLQFAKDYKNSDYTVETLEPFNEAYEQAKKVLEAQDTNEETIKEALDNLKSKKELLKGVPLDYSKLEEKIAEADKIIENQKDYDVEPLMNLKKYLPMAKEMLEKGAEVKSQLDEMVTNLETALGNITKKSSDAKFYYIQGSLDSMANGFLDPQILLEEREGQAIYTIGLNKDATQKYVKHIQDGQQIYGVQVTGTEDYPNRYRIVRNKLGEEKIDLVMFPILMGVEKTTALELNLSTKRSIDSQEDKGKIEELKKELAELLSAEGETFDKASAGGVYKALGAGEYIKAYDAAIKEKNNVHATEDSLNKVMDDLKTKKNKGLTFERKYIGQYKEDILKLQEDAKVKLAEVDKYTEESLGKLKEAFAEYEKVAPPTSFNKILFTMISAGDSIKILRDLDNAVKGLKIDITTTINPENITFDPADEKILIKTKELESNAAEIILKTTAIESIKNADKPAEIKTNLGTVLLDKKLIETIEKNSKDVVLKISKITKPENLDENLKLDNFYEIKIETASKEKIDFQGGKATITIPAVEGTKYAYHIVDGKIVERLPVAISGQAMSWLTTHFSTWTTSGEEYKTEDEKKIPVIPVYPVIPSPEPETPEKPETPDVPETPVEPEKPETVNPSDVKAPKTATTRLSTAKGGYDDIYAKWSKSENADGYYVYARRVNVTKKWSYLGNTTKTSYLKKNLRDGYTYEFKIVPYVLKDGKKVKSDNYKKSTLTTTLKQVKLNSVKKYSNSKIKINWTNIKGETGYEISKSKSSKGTNIVSTIKTTKGKYKILKTKKNHGYYYKVRGYKTVNGKKVYAPWSKVKYYKVH